MNAACTFHPAASALTDQMRRHGHAGVSYSRPGAQVVAQTVDQRSKPNPVLFPRDHHLGSAFREGVFVFVVIELRQARPNHVVRLLKLVVEHGYLAGIRCGFTRGLRFLLAPVSEIYDLDFLATAQDKPMRDVADVELGIVIRLEIRVESRVAGPCMQRRALDQRLDGRLRERWRGTRIGAIVRVQHAAINSRLGDLHIGSFVTISRLT
jgi:hypothetical protein